MQCPGNFHSDFHLVWPAKATFCDPQWIADFFCVLQWIAKIFFVSRSGSQKKFLWPAVDRIYLHSVFLPSPRGQMHFLFQLGCLCALCVPCHAHCVHSFFLSCFFQMSLKHNDIRSFVVPNMPLLFPLCIEQLHTGKTTAPTNVKFCKCQASIHGKWWLFKHT